MRFKLLFLTLLFSNIAAANIEITINRFNHSDNSIIEEKESLFSGDYFQIQLSGFTKNNIYVVLKDSSEQTSIIAAMDDAKNLKTLLLPSANKGYQLDNKPGLETIYAINTDEKFNQRALISLINKGQLDRLSGDYVINKYVLRHADNNAITRGYRQLLNSRQKGQKSQLPDSFNNDFAISLKTSDIEKKLAINLITNSDSKESPKTRGINDIKIYKEIAPSVVYIENYNDEDKLNGSGSGSILSKDTVLTNWHVIRGHHSLLVGLKPKRGSNIDKNQIYNAEVIRVDAVKDLALLKLDKIIANRRPIKFGDSDKLEVGEDVHAIGHPGAGALWTYTKGYISQFHTPKKWSYSESRHEVDTMIQTQTPINPGNSGGPLLNGDGELIGVNTSKADAQNINFSVSVNDVKAFMSNSNRNVAVKKKTKNKVEEFKATMKAAGINILKIIELDHDENGEKDIVIYLDQDKNDKAEKIYVYLKKGNKNQLVKYIDPDEDGKWNEMAIDLDMNGKIDTHFFDEDGDQKSDVVGYDDDEDGVIDEYKEV